MIKGDDIEERLIEFAVRIIRVSEALPKSYVGQHIGSQNFCAAVLLRHRNKVKLEAQKARETLSTN